MIDRMADIGNLIPTEAVHAKAILFGELSVHLAQEEDDPFPLAGRRCAQVDDIGCILDRGKGRHPDADFDTPRVAVLLRGRADGLAIGVPARARQAARARRQLVHENIILRPLRRNRLTSKELKALDLSMTGRRGLDAPEESAHAE